MVLSPMDMKPTTAKELKTQIPFVVAGFFIQKFSRIGQRAPPSPEKTQHVRLVSISVSHYVEKVRWALDLLEVSSSSPVYFTEDLHAPAFASMFTVPASEDKASQTPMVVLPDKRVLWGSDTILREFCSSGPVNLYPTEVKEAIVAMEDDLDMRLGASGRCYAYGSMLDKEQKYYPLLVKQATNYCPTVEHAFFEKMLDKGIDKALIQLMKISPEMMESSAAEMRKVFQELSDLLEQNSGNYLMDSKANKVGFTAADLTFASLVYFIVRPVAMLSFLPPESEQPPAMVELFQELTNTKAGQHALKIYRERRPVDKATGSIFVKNVDQNCNPLKFW